MLGMVPKFFGHNVLICQMGIGEILGFLEKKLNNIDNIFSVALST